MFLSRLRAQGAFRIGDVLEWNAECQGYITKDSDAARFFSALSKRGAFWMTREASNRLLRLECTRTQRPPLLPLSKLKLGSEPVANYTPSKGRCRLLGSLDIEPAVAKWTRQSSRSNRQGLTMLTWKRVFKSSIEPKQQSLLWLMQHGEVMTAHRLAQWYDAISPNCTICRRAIESLPHMFFECERVRDFWQRVGRFLDRIQSHATTNSDPVTLSDVLNGLKRWQNRVPNLAIFHAEAVWQVYRAHTESTQRGVVSSAVAIFARWHSAMQCRIRNDFYNARKVNRLERFSRSWSRIRCQWFVYDSGGEGRAPSITFHPLYAIPHQPEPNE
jgi:hypothetical protein